MKQILLAAAFVAFMAAALSGCLVLKSNEATAVGPVMVQANDDMMAIDSSEAVSDSGAAPILTGPDSLTTHESVQPGSVVDEPVVSANFVPEPADGSPDVPCDCPWDPGCLCGDPDPSPDPPCDCPWDPDCDCYRDPMPDPPCDCPWDPGCLCGDPDPSPEPPCDCPWDPSCHCSDPGPSPDPACDCPWETDCHCDPAPDTRSME